MSITCPCEDCGRWLAPDQTEICVDCQTNLCHECAVATHHRTVHEDTKPDEAEVMPEGWTYLRCGYTPYTIHDEAL